MPIILDTQNDRTIIRCESCDLSAATEKANGIVPSDWMTGHLWLDMSLSEQRQTPLCFCPDCAASIRGSASVSITIS